MKDSQNIVLQCRHIKIHVFHFLPFYIYILYGNKVTVL